MGGEADSADDLRRIVRRHHKHGTDLIKVMATGGPGALVTLLGFRPEEVIAMATTEAAAALGLGAVTGRLAPGYDADLIVVDGDPAPTSPPSAGCAA